MGALLSCVAGKYKGGGAVLEALKFYKRQKGIQAWGRSSNMQRYAVLRKLCVPIWR
jgi:hypothetical protein